LADHSDPLHSYETQWAWNVLHLALAAVRSQYEAQGKIDLFEALCPLLTRESSQSLAEIAERLGMQVGAVKVAAHRLRDRYGQQIRLQIARTVDDPQEVDEELRELFRVFSADRL
jgi:RNA polymerase sigma-70 factor (ECF subfamily)